MKVCWIDTETGGVDPTRHGLIQLAYLIDIDGEIKKEGILYSNCEGKSYTEAALAVNHFTPEQVRNFPPPKEMYLELKKILTSFVNPYDKNREAKFIFGGYNAGFDLKFIEQLWNDHNDVYLFSFFNHGLLDPAIMARFLQYARHDFPAGLKLGLLADYLKIKPYGGELHDAMVDIKLTRDVAREMLKRYIRAKPRLPIADTLETT